MAKFIKTRIRECVGLGIGAWQKNIKNKAGGKRWRIDDGEIQVIRWLLLCFCFTADATVGST
mgnify:CR=1 FL=1